MAVKNDARLAWAALAVWVAVIFACVPVARTMEQLLRVWAGGSVFMVLVGVVATSVVAWFVRRVLKDGQGHVASRLTWLVITGAGFCALAFGATGGSVEALHFVEYGVLAGLAYRALRYHLRDICAYPAAVILCGCIGILDEFFQWTTPGRVWDYGDIAINSMAAAVVVLGIGLVGRPDDLRRSVAATSLARLSGLCALLMLLLTLSLQGTPANLRALTARGLLPAGDGIMTAITEYGYAHRDPELGTFKSRLDPLALRQASQSSSGSERFRQFRSHARYPAFMKECNPADEPFLYEARVHLFRRDHHLGTLWQKVRGPEFNPALTPADIREHATIAVREHQLLERHFGKIYLESGVVLGARELAWLAPHVRSGPYHSPVSGNLVTFARPETLCSIGLAMTLAFALIGLGCRWRASGDRRA